MIPGHRDECPSTQVWGIPSSAYKGPYHGILKRSSNEQYLPSRTEVMILTTLIALWTRKGSFKQSAVRKVFCPASDACWDRNRVRTLSKQKSSVAKTDHSASYWPILGGCKMSRSLFLSTRILKLYIEALTRYSHVVQFRWSEQPLTLSRLLSLEQPLM